MDSCDECRGDERVACINGTIYVPCEHPNCYGACESNGRCDCRCHKSIQQQADEPESEGQDV